VYGGVTSCYGEQWGTFLLIVINDVHYIFSLLVQIVCASSSVVVKVLKDKDL